MGMIPATPLPELNVPISEILKMSKGDIPKALEIAAGYGYQLACSDLSKFTRHPSSAK